MGMGHRASRPTDHESPEDQQQHDERRARKRDLPVDDRAKDQDDRPDNGSYEANPNVPAMRIQLRFLQVGAEPQRGGAKRSYLPGLRRARGQMALPSLDRLLSGEAPNFRLAQSDPNDEGASELGVKHGAGGLKSFRGRARREHPALNACPEVCLADPQLVTEYGGNRFGVVTLPVAVRHAGVQHIPERNGERVSKMITRLGGHTRPPPGLPTLCFNELPMGLMR